MEKKILLIGASGHGKVVADIAIKNGYEVIGFLDDNPEIKELMNIPVIGKVSEAVNYVQEAFLCVSIGNANARKRIIGRTSPWDRKHCRPGAVQNRGCCRRRQWGFRAGPYRLARC